MVKTETICESCDSHYIIVTRAEEKISYCPICSEPLDIDEVDLNIEGDEE